jgi:hypothetical protein
VGKRPPLGILVDTPAVISVPDVYNKQHEQIMYSYPANVKDTRSRGRALLAGVKDTRSRRRALWT